MWKIEVKYSVDMVRMKIKVHKLYFSHFQKMYLEFNPAVNYYLKHTFKDYRHNFVIKELDPFGNEFSYWLGYAHNAQRSSSDSTYLVIEYNPNKCISTGLLEGILHTFFKFDIVTVCSLDIAMDVDININSLIVDKCRKKNYKLFDYGGDDKTHYFGDGDGQIKIYNKAREMGVEGNLTRYEISKKIDLPISDMVLTSYEFDGEILPLSYMNDIEIKDKTLSAVYYSVLNGYPINELSRDYKNRIRRLLKDNCSIEFDIKKISSTICQWFQGYREMYILKS